MAETRVGFEVKPSVVRKVVRLVVPTVKTLDGLAGVLNNVVQGYSPAFLGVAAGQDGDVSDISRCSALYRVRDQSQIVRDRIEYKLILVDDLPDSGGVGGTNTSEVAAVVSWTSQSGSQVVPSRNRRRCRSILVADLARL